MSSISNTFKPMKLLESCDIIGREPKLKLANSGRNRTVWGGFLCLSIYLLMILGFLYFGQEIYFKVVPATVVSSELIEQEDSISLDKNNFLFFLSIKDRFGNFIKEEDGYFNFNIYLENYISSNGKNLNEESALLNQTTYMNKTVLTMETCSTNSFGKYSDLLSYVNPNNWKCLKSAQDRATLPIIKGGLHFPLLSNLKIQITKCIKGTCKSSSEINDKLNGAYVVIKYYDAFFNFRNFTNFIENVFREDKIYLFSDWTKSVKYEIMQVETFSDKGYILEDFSIEKVFLKNSFLEFISYVNNYETINKNNTTEISQNFLKNILCDISFQPSYEKKTFYRKYYKVQNLVAEMGGLAKSFVVLAYFLNFFHDHAKYYEKLIDSLFDIEDLFKYYQYYNPQDKKIFKKYRDSIILKNTKALDDLRAYEFEKNSSSVHNIKHNNYLHGLRLNKNVKVTDAKTENYFQQDNISETETTKKRTEDLREVRKLDEQANHENGNDQNENLESIESNNEMDNYIENLKKNSNHKENFYKLKKRKFTLNFWEYIKIFFCSKKPEFTNKYNIVAGGREMINTRTDIIYIMKKNLELDRFKNLMLKDYQILLLNSLSKFMLDPERVNLVNFENCTYEKMLDAYGASLENNTRVDRNLCNWVRSKFHIE